MKNRIIPIIGLMLAMGLLLSHGLVMADNVIISSSSVSMSSSQSGTSSEASFSGHDGKHVVDDDVVEIRQGQLTVNGMAYGAVTPASAIRYTVQGDKKTLMVDGQVRPLRK